MRCTSWSLCTLYLLTCQVTENAASTTSHPMGKEKFLIQLWQLCCPWSNIGNECQQVPEQGPVVHPCWGHWTVGFLWRNLWECTRKVKSVTNTTMVCPTLECALAVWCPHKHKDIQLLEKGQWRAVGYMTSNYTDRSVLENLNWSCLEQQRWQTWLEMLHKISNDLVDIIQQASSAKGGNIDESLWQGVQTEILFQRNDCYYWNMHTRLGLHLKHFFFIYLKNKKHLAVWTSMLFTCSPPGPSCRCWTKVHWRKKLTRQKLTQKVVLLSYCTHVSKLYIKLK